MACPVYAWTSKEPIRGQLTYRENAVVLNKNAEALLRQGRAQEATQTYQQALRFNPGSSLSATLYNGMGQSYETQGQYAQAVMSYQYAIGYQPDFALPYQNLVRLWKRAQRLPAARDNLQTILAFNPDDGWAWYLMAQVQAALGDFMLEQEAMRRFVRLEPRSAIRNQWCRTHPADCSNPT